LLTRYTENTFNPRFFSTVGIDFKEKKINWKPRNSESVIRGQRVLLQLWDTAGQERFRSLTTAFFRDAMGFILVFDVTAEQSLLSTRDWIDQLSIHAYTEKPDIVLCGNKIDLDQERMVSSETAQEFANALGVKYIETSAATGAGVDQAVDLLLDQVMCRIESRCQEEVVKKWSPKLEEKKRSCNCS